MPERREDIDVRASGLSAVATTGRKWSKSAEEAAKWAATHIGIPYTRRRTESIDEVRKRTGATFLIVAKKGILYLVTPTGELFFHPNMAHLRLKNLRFGSAGKGDHMAEAMGLAPGMSVLDCTLGFGADAIVSSFSVGAKGHVEALESNPLIEAVVSYGLANFKAENWPIQEAMRTVQTHYADALTFLKTQEKDSFDVIYFDPMFRHPLEKSISLSPLREVADMRALTRETIEEAKRVAKHRVVMKENARSAEFIRLGFKKVVGGTYSKVHYGVIEL